MWETLRKEEVERKLGANFKNGLTNDEVSKRQNQYGKNELENGKKEGIIIKFFKQFNDFMIIILIMASIVSAGISWYQGENDYIDSIIIIAIVVLNALMGVLQEAKAEKSIESLKKMTPQMSKVIREGNYTNFPGFYGFLFRNADTLPLSSNRRTMVEFIKAVDVILQRGDCILIYPEQSMWWNYTKPKPLKIGAYKFAKRNNVPIIPIFITMRDSEIIGEDGFPVQEYYINIEKPIYPNKKLSEREDAEIMRQKNFDTWKKVYEDFYKIPLEYTTVKREVINN